MKNFFRWVIHILVVYCIAGLVYGFTGLISRNLQGKAEVISPLIGLPMDMVSWPWMVYADLRNIGILLQDVLALVSIILCIVLLVYFNTHVKRED